jgi:hypothetical protein
MGWVPPGVTTIDTLRVSYQTSNTDSAISNLDSIVIYNQAATANVRTRVDVITFGDASNTALTTIDSTRDISGLVYGEQLAFTLWGHIDANQYFRANVWVYLKR